MKKRHVFITSLLLSNSLLTLQAKDEKIIQDLLSRIAVENKVHVDINKRAKDVYFMHEVKDGSLYVEASDNVAAARGIYDYIKENGYGIYSWSGSNIRLPQQLSRSEEKKVISPFENHYYFNVVTYGYTMPYWDWTRWEQEIDWMALHGFNMPLTLVAQEAIMARVWKKMGLTDEEINNYFVGPAHLPWMRMGNISDVGGPLNADWHEGQVALQHKILKRMRDLDMKPICPGFSGFVPEAMKRIHPELKLVKTNWAGAFHNWMISPEQELFAEIGTAFIKEWEKEFGKNDYYLIDSFNEMEIPFPAKGTKERYELLASYGDAVYKSIKNANPKAVWTMQGWMFGYQRYIWDYETLEALFAKVPKEKALLLDLAVDYNKHFWHSQVNWEFYKGFYNIPWIYSVIPNMGGKVGLTGVLDFYANGHLEALNSPDKGRLVGYGMAPEGIENNEVIYELVSDAGWKSEKVDLSIWLENYFNNRYEKQDVGMHKAWEDLRKSVYGSFTDHPRYNWQFRPGRIQNGSILISDAFFSGLEKFVALAPNYKTSELYKTDLVEFTAHYLGGKAEILINQIEECYLLGDLENAQYLESRFETLMTGMDLILQNHPTLRLDRWLDFAAKHARNEDQRQQYVSNAKRLVTIWGPPVDDYAAKIWSGLIEDYYLPRWKHYFASKKSGQPFNFAQWEEQWVDNTTTHYPATKSKDVIALATSLIHQAKDISKEQLYSYIPNCIGLWSMSNDKSVDQKFEFVISAKTLKRLKGFEFAKLHGEGGFLCKSVKIIADGKTIVHKTIEANAAQEKNLLVDLKIPSNVNANNQATVEIVMMSTDPCAGSFIYY